MSILQTYFSTGEIVVDGTRLSSFGVRYIEEDQFVAGNLLTADGNGISTHNLLTGVSDPVAGVSHRGSTLPGNSDRRDSYAEGIGTLAKFL